MLHTRLTAVVLVSLETRTKKLIQFVERPLLHPIGPSKELAAAKVVQVLVPTKALGVVTYPDVGGARLSSGLCDGTHHYEYGGDC